MYILELFTRDGTDYVGPFPTKERARRYAAAAETIDSVDFTILELTVPYAVVKKVEWR